MKRLFVAVSSLFCLVAVLKAQNIEGRLLTLNQKHATLVAVFTETEVMPRLKKELTKKGMFYFASPESLVMRYTDPEGDLMLVKDGKFIVRRSGKVQKYAVKSDDSPMRLLRNTLIYSLQGDVRRVAEENRAKLTCKESSTRFVITVERKQPQKTGVNSLQLVYDKITGALLSLRMDKANGNYTLYEAHEGVQGQVIPDDVWVID